MCPVLSSKYLGNLAYTSKTDKYDSFLKLTCIVTNLETGDLFCPPVDL